MNKRRRQNISNAVGLLQKAYDIVDRCRDEEEDAKANLEGTSLEYTGKFEMMESSHQYLENAAEKIEDAIDELSSAMYP